jgi:twitching motility protein PilT
MIFELLKQCYERGASDLHFKVGYPPVLRIDGSMVPLKRPDITEFDYENMLESILDDTQRVKFNENQKMDVSYSFSNARYRVNLFYDQQGGSSVFRMIPFAHLSFDDIGLPKSARLFSTKPYGLVLVTGATGAGKSTTLVSFINHIATNSAKSIMTIEDPIEYLFEDKKSLVSQRQVGVDCHTFEDGIVAALQTDVDVIMVGELREAEAVAMALTAAESGKLVFATIHSNTAPQGIDRFMNLFPQSSQEQILTRLASSLVGIVTQTLVPKKLGKGRVAAFEILVGLPFIRGLITEGRIHMIQSYQESGQETGMCTLDQSLAKLVNSEKIALDEALMRAVNQDSLRKLIDQTAIEPGGAPV